MSEPVFLFALGVSMLWLYRVAVAVDMLIDRVTRQREENVR